MGGALGHTGLVARYEMRLLARNRVFLALAALAVAGTPLALYGMQEGFMFWHQVALPCAIPAANAVVAGIPLSLLAVFAAVMAVDLAATVRTIARMNKQLSQLDELAGRLREVSNELGEHLAVRVIDAAEAGDDLREDFEDGLDQLREAAERRRRELLEGMDEVKDSLAQRRFQLRMDQAEWLAERERDLDELRSRLEEARGRYIFGQKRLLAAFPRMRSLDHKRALERLRRWLEKR